MGPVFFHLTINKYPRLWRGSIFEKWQCTMNNGGKKGMLPVNYSGLIPLLIESVKEQQQQINELKKVVEILLDESTNLCGAEAPSCFSKSV